MTTLFEFAQGMFTVPEDSRLEQARGRYFEQLDKAQKTAFWGYQFSVEYLPEVDETILNDVFHRINKNVAKLTAQELRHARYNGVFTRSCEALAEWLLLELPDFPRIVPQSQRQMKDVELVAQLLLQLEDGEPRGYSQDELDKAFADRDAVWETQAQRDEEFREVVRFIKKMLVSPEGDALRGSRLRNQLDFYSLFGAVAAVIQRKLSTDPAAAALALRTFVAAVEDEQLRSGTEGAQRYYEAARSAANDTGQRKTRAGVLLSVMTGAA